MDNLISKIQSMNLTKTEKVIADYILDNINNIGLSTVTDISLKLGVSDTSITVSYTHLTLPTIA